MDIIAGFIFFALTFGGGYFTGQYRQKQLSKNEVAELVRENQIKIDQLQIRIDSLRSVPAKIDTIVKYIPKIVERTDTLILISKDTYLNTDTIKLELRDFYNEYQKER